MSEDGKKQLATALEGGEESVLIPLDSGKYHIFVKTTHDWVLSDTKDSFIAAMHARELAIGWHAATPEDVMIFKEVEWQTTEVQ